MEIYEEYFVWDHEILVGFYVSKNLKAQFDAVCRSEGSRNGKVLAELMSDYVVMQEFEAEEKERLEKIATKNNLAAFLEAFGTPKAIGSDDLFGERPS